MNRIWQMTLLIVGILFLDQFSKGAIQSSFKLGETLEVIPGFFNLTYVRNPGVAFGMGGSFPDVVRMVLFKILPVIACFWFVYLIWDARKKSYLLCLAYSMIFAGAVGNLIDRISLDYVVDMFDFYYGGWHFAAFNVADASISVAAGIYIIDYFLTEYKGKKKSANT
ncbi:MULTISPECIES: signal peptidase II [Halobacteriovorax]|uniref:Lipoprotein signal peptidase n=1 Tax=Halobacteriovorax vibrionivorans TaxID=2152716 RepID=A0ABY0IK37_9BACT|nr:MULTISPECIES: signal peptidase II [Halobacteriovorax]AYF45964.1 signal peptidase II [Halobacteriovorax sp. BALOs_7]RZF22992.1 signal peptidase II [Halobacteriovorax vibrionivorans]TGD46865.1 signal peptidase II [Halobacteriovorax sp. Y22]